MPGSCGDPRCPGYAWFNGCEIQRCDQCDIFPNDDEALAAACVDLGQKQYEAHTTERGLDVAAFPWKDLSPRDHLSWIAVAVMTFKHFGPESPICDVCGVNPATQRGDVNSVGDPDTCDECWERS